MYAAGECPRAKRSPRPPAEVASVHRPGFGREGAGAHVLKARSNGTVERCAKATRRNGGGEAAARFGGPEGRQACSATQESLAIGAMGPEEGESQWAKCACKYPVNVPTLLHVTFFVALDLRVKI